jgi:DNA-binding NtrC family response regulator
MASRAELRQACREMRITSTDLTKEEMLIKIREVADKWFKKKWAKFSSADKLSTTLKKILTEEYNFVIRDKEGNELDHLGRIKKIKKKKNTLDKKKDDD